MKRTLFCLSLVGLSLVTSAAFGDEKGTITLPVTNVVGNVRRPSVVVEVTKARMTLPSTTPTLSGAAKVQAAAKKDPF